MCVPKKIPAYQALARLLNHVQRVERADEIVSSHVEAAQRSCEDIDWMLANVLPSGSGFDCGTKLDMESSTPDKLVFLVEFHHMDPNGFYAGWTSHKVTVRPSLANRYEIAVSGPSRNAIKDYIHESFRLSLDEAVDPYPTRR